LDEMLAALEALPLATTIRTSVWAYPAIETLHIAAFAALFGSLLSFEMRVFGFARSIPLAALMRLAVPLALAAFGVAAATGGLMLIARATEIVPHPAFQAKLALIALAAVNAWSFHRRLSVVRHDFVARLQALLSLLLWLGVIAAGRLIAYL
jgi:hypothetical protein